MSLLRRAIAISFFFLSSAALAGVPVSSRPAPDENYDVITPWPRILATKTAATWPRDLAALQNTGQRLVAGFADPDFVGAEPRPLPTGARRRRGRQCAPRMV